MNLDVVGLSLGPTTAQPDYTASIFNPFSLNYSDSLDMAGIGASDSRQRAWAGSGLEAKVA